MFIAITFSKMEAFETDLDTLKTKEEEHLNSAQVAEELKEELERLGESGEETHVYRTQKSEFHFTMDGNDGLTLNIHYTGYKQV